MPIEKIVIAAITQGLTEFLPISSSGHLLLLRSLGFNYSQPIIVDIFLHLGSLLAILWFFRNLTLNSLKQLARPLIISFIPAGLFGLLIYYRFESLFEAPSLLGLSFLITSIFIFLFSAIPFGKTRLTKVSTTQALFAGVFQALAIIPAISRSGATLLGVKLAKLDSPAGFSFTFLMAIPAITASVFLALSDLPSIQMVSLPLSLVGTFISFVTSLFALKFLRLLIKKQSLLPFAWYTLILSAITFGLFL